MDRAVLPLLLAWAVAGCRTSEPAAASREESAVAAASPAAERGEGKQAAGDAARAGEGNGGEAAVEEGDGKAAAGEPTAVEPGDGKAAAGEAAGVGPSVEPSVEPDAEPSGGDAPAPAVLETYFANDFDEALDDPRFTARKPPKRAEELQGLLDVRPLLGQSVYASPKATADVLATIAPAGLVAASETCMWVTFQHEIEWTKGLVRCGDVFLREPDTGEGLVEMVPVLQTVTREGARWSRIIATLDGRSGWVRTETAPPSFTKVAARYAAGGSRTWDRMLYTEPGASPTKIAFRGAIALRIRETRKVGGRTWLRVEARVDQCIEGSRRKLGEGWMPQHAEGGALNVYYEISC